MNDNESELKNEISKLKRELENAKSTYYSQGYEDAFKDACSVNYESQRSLTKLLCEKNRKLKIEESKNWDQFLKLRNAGLE